MTRLGPVRLVAFGLRGLDRAEGGVETHARELYPRLAALGFDVCVLVRSRYVDPGADWSARGVRVRPLWAPAGRGLEAFVHAALCALTCLATRPDVVHVHGIGPGAFAGLLRLTGIRVVVTHHGHDYDADKWGRLARRLLRAGERRSVRDASAVIAVSSAIAGAVRAQHGVEPVVVRNGTPSWAPRPDAPRRAAATGPGAPYVLVVGRLTAHKRVLDVVEAFDAPAFAGHRLVVCGDLRSVDPYVALVRRAVRDRPRVVLAGHVEPEDLGPLYRGASCTVMASSYEGLPLAVLEAVAAGCPVLASDIPAHLELELSPDQYFRLGDVAQLAQRLAALLEVPRERATAVQAGRARDARYDWDEIARATAAVLTRGTPAPDQPVAEASAR